MSTYSHKSCILFDTVGVEVPYFNQYETGVILANFKKKQGAHYDVPKNWLHQIDKHFGDSLTPHIRFAHLPKTVKSEEQAQELLEITQATFIVWGTVAGEFVHKLMNFPKLIRVNYSFRDTQEMGLRGNPQSSEAYLHAVEPHLQDIYTGRISQKALVSYMQNAGELFWMTHRLLCHSRLESQ